MEKIKTTVDRKPLSSDYIESKQDFGHVLSQVKNLKPPIWKTAWFYGPVGMAVVAVAITATSISPATNLTEQATTSLQQEVVQAPNPPEPQFDVQVASAQDEPPKVIEAQPSERPTPTSDLPVEEEILEELEAVDAEPLPQAVSDREASGTVYMKRMPHINNHYMSENVSVEELEKGVQCNDSKFEIVSFEIHYNGPNGTETEKVQGNKIPEDVIAKIEKYNIGYMFFVTRIKANNLDGNLISLDNMNFIATN